LSRRGRFNNAARQHRFRQRQKQKVTHQGSLKIIARDLLASTMKSIKTAKKVTSAPKPQCCHHCGAGIGAALRRNFIRRRPSKRLF
jgi:hypothetical protein